METQLASPQLSETNDPILDDSAIYLSDQDVATEFQMLIPDADFVIGNFVAVPESISMFDHSFLHDSKEIIIRKEFPGDLAIGHRSAHYWRCPHGLQSILVFDPGSNTFCAYFCPHNYCYGRPSLLSLLYFPSSKAHSTEKQSICCLLIDIFEADLILWNLLISRFEYHGLHGKGILIVRLSIVTPVCVAIIHMEYLHLLYFLIKYRKVEFPVQLLHFIVGFYNCVGMCSTLFPRTGASFGQQWSMGVDLINEFFIGIMKVQNVLWPILVMQDGFILSLLHHHDCYAMPHQLLFEPVQVRRNYCLTFVAKIFQFPLILICYSTGPIILYKVFDPGNVIINESLRNVGAMNFPVAFGSVLLVHQLICAPNISLLILKFSFQFSVPFPCISDCQLKLFAKGMDYIKLKFRDCPNYISSLATSSFTLKDQVWPINTFISWVTHCYLGPTTDGFCIDRPSPKMRANYLFIGYPTNSHSHSGFAMLLVYIMRLYPRDQRSNGCLGSFEMSHLLTILAAIDDATTMQHDPYFSNPLNSLCPIMNLEEVGASVSYHLLFVTWISKGQLLCLSDWGIWAYNYFSKGVFLTLIQEWLASLFSIYLATHAVSVEFFPWSPMNGNNFVESTIANGYSFLAGKNVSKAYPNAFVRWLLDKFYHLKLVSGAHCFVWELIRNALFLSEIEPELHSCAFVTVNEYQFLLQYSLSTPLWVGFHVAHYILCLILDDLGQPWHEEKISPPFKDVISCQYEVVDSLLTDGIEFKFQAGMSFTFMMIVIVPFGNGQHFVSLTISIHFTWIYLILLCWNGLDPPAHVDLGIFHSSFLNLDLEDKVHFNGGSNVMNGPNISNGPVNGSKGKCEIINTDGKGLGSC